MPSEYIYKLFLKKGFYGSFNNKYSVRINIFYWAEQVALSVYAWTHLLQCVSAPTCTASDDFSSIRRRIILQLQDERSKQPVEANKGIHWGKKNTVVHVL